jgi:sacsin
VANAIMAALQDPKSSFDHHFKLCLELEVDRQLTQTTFLVHHSLRSDLMSQDRREWAKREVYFPWVAVAAQISPSEDYPTGSLSTVLPLPIPSSQPVHVHAAFHLSPDRQRLTRVDQESLSSRDDATKWNDWLLHHCIPSTWAKLTTFMASESESQSGFQCWPRQPEATHDNFYGVIDDFLRIIDAEHLSVWPTEAGHLSASQSLLNVNSMSPLLKAALERAKAPIVDPPPLLLSHVKPYFEDRYLSAEALCTFLKQNPESIAKLDNGDKIEILQYLLQEEAPLASFYVLELFPFKSGNFAALEQNSAFIDRDEAEAELFCHETDFIINLKMLSKPIAKLLRHRCTKAALTPYIRYRSWEALSSYSLKYPYADLDQDGDIVKLTPEASLFVNMAWTWIVKYKVDIANLAGDLWLIPTTDGQHRRVVPHNAQSTIFYAPPNARGTFMKSFHDKGSAENCLLDMNLGDAALSTVLSAASRSPGMYIMDCVNAKAFAQWLEGNARSILISSSTTKRLIVELIASSLHPNLDQTDLQSVAESVKGLDIFPKVSWSNTDNKWYVVSLLSHRFL